MERYVHHVHTYIPLIIIFMPVCATLFHNYLCPRSSTGTASAFQFEGHGFDLSLDGYVFCGRMWLVTCKTSLEWHKNIFFSYYGFVRSITLFHCCYMTAMFLCSRFESRHTTTVFTNPVTTITRYRHKMAVSPNNSWTNFEPEIAHLQQQQHLWTVVNSSLWTFWRRCIRLLNGTRYDSKNRTEKTF